MNPWRHALADAARAWHGASLIHGATGQRNEPFDIDGGIEPGQVFVAGGREGQMLAAPGHDRHSVMRFDAAQGVLVSADALSAHGFGVVFPEIAGEPGFDDVGEVLDQIVSLPVKLAIPGHGAPFAGVDAAPAGAAAGRPGTPRPAGAEAADQVPPDGSGLAAGR